MLTLFVVAAVDIAEKRERRKKLNGFFLFLKPIYSIKRAKRVFFAFSCLSLPFLSFAISRANTKALFRDSVQLAIVELPRETLLLHLTHTHYRE
jgi:hypothetical protein